MVNNDIMDRIVVLNELKEFVIPLGREEFAQLEENIIYEGCRDPLVVWERKKGEFILIDGHNRYKICQKHSISFKTQLLKFEDLDQIKFWMINNQLGRRNLNPDQMSYYRGLKYESLKKNRGGYEFVESVGQNELPTYTKLAGEFNVSESTIKRDSKFARGLTVIGVHNPKLKNKILSGESKIRKSDIILFADVNHDEIKNIKNEADLYNKANLLRGKILSNIEDKLDSVKKENIKKAQEELRNRDTLFIEERERINRCKASLVSAINRAIQSRDVEAMNELKQLIEQLENLLFGD